MKLNSRIIDRRIKTKQGFMIYKVIVIDYKDGLGKWKQATYNPKITLQEYERGRKKEFETIRQKFVEEFTGELEKRRGLNLDYANLTVMQLLQKYADHRKSQGKIGDMVYDDYSVGGSYQNKVLEFLNKIGKPYLPASEFTEHHAEAFIDMLRTRKNRDKKPISENTIKHHLVFYKPAFQYGVTKKFIKQNPFANIESPTIKIKKPKFFSPEDSGKIWIEIENEVRPLHAPLQLSILTGARRSEILALRWGDIDWAGGDWTKGSIKIRNKVLEMPGGELRYSETLKTEKSVRDIPLTPEAWWILDEQRKWVHKNSKSALYYHEYSDYVFIDERGLPVRPARLTRALKRICNKHSIEGHLHQLRHSYASYLRKSGVDITIISDLLGHANIGITGNFYLGVDDDDRRTATNKLAEFMSFTNKGMESVKYS